MVDKKTDAAEPVKNTPPVRPPNGKRVVAGKFEIDPDKPLSAFSHEYADAYECVSADTRQADHVAVLIRDRYPVQRAAIEKCLRHDPKNLLQLRSTVLVNWPEDDTKRYALIFRLPTGKQLVTHGKRRFDPLPEEVVRKMILRPLLETLLVLGKAGAFHGSIRPDNIFLTPGDGAEAVLGEFISSIPGINQPAVYETIERAMADPQGKGHGSVGDDVYALGVTAAVLLHGYNPMQDKSNRQIIEEKILHGTYSLLADGLRLSPMMSEFLRSSLSDDPQTRWGIEQITAWLTSGKVPTRASSGSVKAQRSLDFNNKKYIRPRMLAIDLHDNISDAVKIIEDGTLAKWVERALNDLPTADLITAAIGQAGSGPGYEEKLLCLVAIALDPKAPIRFRGMRTFPSGIGYSMAYALLQEESIQFHGEMVRDRYASAWLSNPDNVQVPNQSALLQQADQAAKIITRRGLDYGIERCVYHLCPDTPCLSELFENHYVIDCGALLHALDDVAPASKDKKPIDRHIASFISTRDTSDNAGLMAILDGADPVRYSLAILTMYHQMQKRYDNPKLVQLCEWLSHDAEQVIQRYRSGSTRESLKKLLPKEIKTGSLNRMMVLIDDPVQVKKDDQGFSIASRQYAYYGHERDVIRHNLDTNKNFGLEAGQYTALVTSLLMSATMILITLISYFTGHGG